MGRGIHSLKYIGLFMSVEILCDAGHGHVSHTPGHRLPKSVLSCVG